MDSSPAGSDSSVHLDPALERLAPTPGEQPDLVERICRYMSTQQTNTKKFLLAYLQSLDPSTVKRKKQWGSVKKGWKTTEAILDAIDKLVNAKPQCRQKWNDWVLKKAKVIVAAQSPPTSSLYININKLDTTFFDPKTEVKREATIIKSMDFIHELITFKLGVDKIPGGGIISESSGSDKDSDLESDSGLILHEEFRSKSKSTENYVYHKSNDKAENTKTRLKAIALTIVQMLAFGSNRRCNSLQVQNTITLLACGVSERVNQYLYQVGLSASRKSALRGLLVLAKENAMLIKKKIKAAGTFGFLICIDNLDMMERVHSRRLDATSNLSWYLGLRSFLETRVTCWSEFRRMYGSGFSRFCQS